MPPDSDRQSEQPSNGLQVGVVGKDGLRKPERLEAGPLEDCPEAGRGRETASVGHTRVAGLVGPTADLLGEPAVAADDIAQVDVAAPERGKRGRQLDAEELVSLGGSQIQPALASQEPKTSNGPLLVPVRRYRSVRQGLVGTAHSPKAGKRLDRRTEGRKRLEKAAPPAARVEDPILTTRVIEAAAAGQL